MKKIYLFFLATLLLFSFTESAQAQHNFIKQKIKKKVRDDMKEKYAEPEREKGKEALKDITYENDTRYPVPENPVKATLSLKNSSFKKNGKLKESSNSKMVFGNTGECMIMNEGEKNESRMLFDYKGAATYIIDTKEKTATKMPMINFQSLAQKMAEGRVDSEDSNGEWKKTDEQKKINGYNCRKYEYTNTEEKTKMEAWVTQDISIDLSGNHLFGGQIRDFSTDPSISKSNKTDENIPKGVMIRSVHYEKNRDTPSMQMEITSYKESSDPKYFDLSEYEIKDVLDDL